MVLAQPSLDGRSESQVLQIILFSCLSRARFLLLALCLLATLGHGWHSRDILQDTAQLMCLSSLHQNPQEPESMPASPQRLCCTDTLPAMCYRKETYTSTAPVRSLTSQPPYPHPKPSTELQTK